MRFSQLRSQSAMVPCGHQRRKERGGGRERRNVYAGRELMEMELNTAGRLRLRLDCGDVDWKRHAPQPTLLLCIGLVGRYVLLTRLTLRETDSNKFDEADDDDEDWTVRL